MCLQVLSTACSLLVLLTASSFVFCWIFYPLSSPQREGVCNWFHLFVCMFVCSLASIAVKISFSHFLRRQIPIAARDGLLFVKIRSKSRSHCIILPQLSSNFTEIQWASSGGSEWSCFVMYYYFSVFSQFSIPFEINILSHSFVFLFLAWLHLCGRSRAEILPQLLGQDSFRVQTSAFLSFFKIH